MRCLVRGRGRGRRGEGEGGEGGARRRACAACAAQTRGLAGARGAQRRGARVGASAHGATAAEARRSPEQSPEASGDGTSRPTPSEGSPRPKPLPALPTSRAFRGERGALPLSTRRRAPPARRPAPRAPAAPLCTVGERGGSEGGCMHASRRGSAAGRGGAAARRRGGAVARRRGGGVRLGASPRALQWPYPSLPPPSGSQPCSACSAASRWAFAFAAASACSAASRCVTGAPGLPAVRHSQWKPQACRQLTTCQSTLEHDLDNKAPIV